MSRLRLGCLQLRIETGRYARPPLKIHERICQVCLGITSQQGSEPIIETEIHFLFYCEVYKILREKLFSIIKIPENFETLDEATKLCFLHNMP